MHVRQRLDLLSIGLILAICADVIRPSLDWLAASGVSSWALARNLERSRDPGGFARLRAVLGDSGQITAQARHAAIGRAGILVAAAGGTLAEVTAGDFLELLDAERRVRGRPGDYSAMSWRLLHQAGVFGPHTPVSLAQLQTIGQRTPAELIGRYQLSCRPVRDLLVDYLQERQPALDHNSLDNLAQQLGRNFWADLERHHPGIGSLQPATRGRHRVEAAAAHEDHGARAGQHAASVPAAYLPAHPDSRSVPSTWTWPAGRSRTRPAGRRGPRPARSAKADVNSRKEDRRRKSRMDARTRERLPVLPVLARSAAGHHARAASTCKPPGTPSPAACSPRPATTFTRPAPASPAR